MGEIATRIYNEGPLPSSEIEGSGVQVQDRREGVTKFNPGLSTPHPGTSIYYVRGKHEKEAVIEAWIEENPEVLDVETRQTLALRVGAYGTEWREAWSNVADELYSERGGE